MTSGGPSATTIRCWSAALYKNSLRNWIYGELCLSSNALCFQTSSVKPAVSDQTQYTLYIDFNDVESLNKAMSSVIFPAITVITKEGDTHWFSSFQDRNSTFLIIQHFFLACLHQKPLTTSQLELSSGSLAQRTKLGTSLLQSINDSQSALQRAAINLVGQGEQLQNAASNMQDIHEDLDIVDRITSGLDSWMGRWKMPPSYKTEELIMVKANDIPDVLDLEALYTQVAARKIGAQTAGVFRLAKEGISILDLKQVIIQHFKWSDVSRIRLVSPWEILVTRYLIGQPDLSYGIISMAMPRALSKLQQFVPQKLEYMNPQYTSIQGAENNASPDNTVRQTRKSYVAEDKVKNESINLKTDHCSPTTADELLDQHSVQIKKQRAAEQQIISDAEVSELSATLSSLRSLALDIQVEQDSQLETIDKLTDSVTSATDRLKSNQKRINKLSK